MTEREMRRAAKEFSKRWQGHGDEKQETQRFWMELLQTVFGVENPSQYIEFEVPVKLSHTSFIDALIPTTHVLIEQKGMEVDLSKGAKQSDGSLLTPYGQARRYGGNMDYKDRPRWIVVSNFQEFHIHDMNRPNDAPEIIALCDLEKEYHRLQFLIDQGNESIKKEMEVSIKAGALVGRLYDEILKEYLNPDDPETLKSLNILCVRLVFCLYAEDAGIFGGHNKFCHYLGQFPTNEVRGKLIELFSVLNQPPSERDRYMESELASFPYVNGGLFAEQNIEIPQFNETIVNLLLHGAGEDFDWSEISPTIFGAVFESTLNPETRRSGGMHYTSIENIHKVIDPLFLDALKEELETIKAEKVATTRKKKTLCIPRKTGISHLF